jgi:hypothetical protein
MLVNFDLTQKRENLIKLQILILNRKTKYISLDESDQSSQKRFKSNHEINSSNNARSRSHQAEDQTEHMSNSSRLKRTHLSTSLPIEDDSNMSCSSNEEDLNKKQKFNN